jgi:hypothetical protein
MEFGDEFAGRAANCAGCGREVAIPTRLKQCSGCQRSLATELTECPACGADLLYGAPPLVPFSGDEVAAPSTPRHAKMSVMAVASLVLGLASFGFWCAAGPPAIVLGIAALARIRNSFGRLKGQRVATSGIVAAGCALVVSAVVWLFIAPFYWGIAPVGVSILADRALSTQCASNLRRISTALHSYHRQWNSFPPAITYDARGRAMHSWRVLILSHLGEQALYAEYRMDEPWDSVRNLAVGEKMPDVFRCPADSSFGGGFGGAANFTSYVVVVGPGTAFPPDGTVSLPDILDGRDQTILVAEATAASIHWTRPEDPVLDSASSGLDSLGGLHDDGYYVLTADGTVRFVDYGTDPGKLQGRFTIRGREATLRGGDRRW